MAEKKNICITINSLASGGAEKQSMLLAKALQPYHNPILVILSPQPVYPPRLKIIEDDRLEHIFLSKNPIKKLYQFFRILKERKIEIIFSFLPKDTILAALCGKAARVPYIFGGIRTSSVVGIKYMVLRTVNNHWLNYTISNNLTAYHLALAFGFKKNVMVIPNGIEIRPLSQRMRSDNQLVTLISMGRLVKSKGFEMALQSVAQLKHHLHGRSKLKFRIIGQGPGQKDILRNIAKYDLEKEVDLITKPTNVYDLLGSSDIYISTSTEEGISNSIMEAMNCALPVVATDAGDNSRLVIHNKNGFITGIHDYKKFADHLFYLVTSPDAREQMGLEGYQHLTQNFGFETFQKKYLKLIDIIEAIHIDNGNLRYGEVGSISSE